MRTFLLAASAAMLFKCAAAQEAPRLGLLYNQVERYSIIFRCSPIQSGAISCDFVQTGVRPKATYGDLPAALSSASKEFAQRDVMSKDDCGMTAMLVGILEGKLQPPKADALDSMSPVMKRDMLAVAQASKRLCDNKTEANYLEVIRLTQDRDRRTCQVSSLSFTQRFLPAPDSAGAVVWLAQSKPEGACGVVQLSRFELERVSIGRTSFPNWRYTARKAITNPTREFVPGARCNGLDEQPYLYDWRAKEHQLSCDYIEFSPI
jgi:hypothetical protein